MARSILMLMILMGLALTAQARKSCSEDWICVESRLEKNRVIVRAQNLRQWPVTISLRMVSRQLPARFRRTVNVTIDGGSEADLLDFESESTITQGDLRFYFDWTVGRLDVDHDDQYLYRLPFASGSTYRVLQGFGSRFSHTGLETYTVDFDMPVGTPVYAARDGTVVRVVEHHDRGCWDRGCGRYANYIVILHQDGSTGEYYHLEKNGALVEVGEQVARGDLIARSGNTGHTTMPHLHFGVYKADSWGRTKSIRFSFASRDGIISVPRPGRKYQVE